MRIHHIAAVFCALGLVGAQQATNDTQPTTNSTQPTTNSTQPTTNSTQPATNSTQPATNSTQPATNSTQPATNSTQPAGDTNTIFQILSKTDGSSPAFQIIQYLQSSPQYQPIIDILNNPSSNVTLFVPSDQVFNQITGQQPTQSNFTTAVGANSTANDNSTAAAPTSDVSSGMASSTPVTEATSQQQHQPSTAAPTDAGATPTSSFALSDFLSPISTAVPSNILGNNQAKYVRLPFAEDSEPQDAERVVIEDPNTSNFIMRVLSKIKLVNSPVLQRRQQQDSITAVSTSPYASQFSVLDLIYYHLVNGSYTLENTTTIFNSLLTNSTVNRFGSGSPLLVQPGSTGNLTVGDGLGNDADINSTIQASNGMIYVIDKVLVPPVNTTDTLKVVQNTIFFNLLLARSNTSANTLNSATNITIFVPANSALQNLDLTSLNNQTLDNLVQAHVFPGVYYSTNLTAGSPLNATSVAGTNVTLQKFSDTGGITVNGTNVVQPNIIMNNGVMHLIDGILNYPTVQAPGQNPSQTPDGVGPFPAPANTPSSSIVSAAVPTLASLFFILSSTFAFYFVYV